MIKVYSKSRRVQIGGYGYSYGYSYGWIAALTKVDVGPLSIILAIAFAHAEFMATAVAMAGTLKGPILQRSRCSQRPFTAAVAEVACFGRGLIPTQSDHTASLTNIADDIAQFTANHYRYYQTVT